MRNGFLLDSCGVLLRLTTPMRQNLILSVQIPGVVDEFLANKAKQRLTSKSAIVRGILLDHLKGQGVDVIINRAKPAKKAVAA